MPDTELKPQQEKENTDNKVTILDKYRELNEKCEMTLERINKRRKAVNQ